MSQQRFTKEELRDKLDGNELDLSLCNLSKVPVREIVSDFLTRALWLICLICYREFRLVRFDPSDHHL